MCVLSGRFFFQAEDGIRDSSVTGVQTCAIEFSPVRHANHIEGYSNVNPLFISIEKGMSCPIKEAYLLIAISQRPRVDVHSLAPHLRTLRCPTVVPERSIGCIGHSRIETDANVEPPMSSP